MRVHKEWHCFLFNFINKNNAFLFIMFLCVCARAAAYTGAGILT